MYDYRVHFIRAGVKEICQEGDRGRLGAKSLWSGGSAAFFSAWGAAAIHWSTRLQDGVFRMFNFQYMDLIVLCIVRMGAKMGGAWLG